VLIYGAAGLGEVDQDTADRSIQEALDAGINHFDVAASYGEAESRLGPWMPRIRGDVFLATKTTERGRDSAWKEINESLEKLQTDHVDLLQLHSIGDLAELDKVTAEGGALEAAVRAQGEGLVRAIGITHTAALSRYPFATVLTPLNVALAANSSYLASYGSLVEEVQRQDAGLMLIKTVARRNWPRGSARRYATWYEPLDDQGQITAAVSWALGQPTVTGIATPGDVSLLGMVIEAERSRMDPDAGAELVGAVAALSSPFLDTP
jgi:aryl-alcohol dehydrogenase-like predicted oxidoreductase